MFKNDIATSLLVGRNGSLTRKKSKRTNPRSNHRRSDTQYDMAMRQTWKIHC